MYVSVNTYFMSKITIRKVSTNEEVIIENERIEFVVGDVTYNMYSHSFLDVLNAGIEKELLPWDCTKPIYPTKISPEPSV